MIEEQIEEYICGFFEELPLVEKVRLAELEGLILPDQWQPIIKGLKK